jgi:hypothetical protein
MPRPETSRGAPGQAPRSNRKLRGSTNTLPARTEQERGVVPFNPQAVEAKLEDQEEFVRWWKEAVRPNHRPEKTVAERGQLTADTAEDLTGITKQQVSRWAKRL